MVKIANLGGWANERVYLKMGHELKIAPTIGLKERLEDWALTTMKQLQFCASTTECTKVLKGALLKRPDRDVIQHLTVAVEVIEPRVVSHEEGIQIQFSVTPLRGDGQMWVPVRNLIIPSHIAKTHGGIEHLL